MIRVINLLSYFGIFAVSHLAMKPGGSSLNPYAAAYVPLSKRQGYSGDGELRSGKPATQHAQYQPHVGHGFGVQGMGSYPGPQMSMPKTSPDMAYKQMRDEDLEMDMDIEFLLVTFSGLSHESINDVYLANNGDLDATIEMLTQLEVIHSLAISLTYYIIVCFFVCVWIQKGLWKTALVMYLQPPCNSLFNFKFAVLTKLKLNNDLLMFCPTDLQFWSARIPPRHFGHWRCTWNHRGFNIDSFETKECK